MITATNEDNMLMMKRYEDNFFDLAIVDPPYGIDINKSGRLGHYGGKGKKWDNETPTQEYFTELKRVSKNQIVWGGNYFELNPTRCFLIWDKMQEFSGATFEVAWTSFKSPSKAFRMSRVQAYCNRTKIHPTQKPVKLYEWQLMRYAEKGFKILDTHRGSASLDIACHNLGFDLVTCELDTDYFNSGNKRLKIHQQQLTMF